MKGSASIKVNEAPAAAAATDPETETADLRLKIVPEHPGVVDGVPYALTTLACPAGASIDTDTAGFAYIQNTTMSILDEIEAWKGAGCIDSLLVEVEPDAGFREIYRRGNQVLLIRDAGAEGFSVRILAEHGGDFPSDKVSYFGADADISGLPGLEDLDIEALDQELRDQFDLDGDGVLSVADIDVYLSAARRLDADDEGEVSLDREEEDRLEALTDIDGDGESASLDDEMLITEAIGDLVLDRALEVTPAEC